MSTATPQYPSAVHPSAVAQNVQTPTDETPNAEEIRVYGHGPLFYWWPVWLLGFVFAALTYFDGHVMAVVPEGTVVEQNAVVEGQGPRDVLVPPAGEAIPVATGRQVEGESPRPRLRVAASNNYGVIFVCTLLFVVVVNSFMLRGLASVIAVAILIILSLTFALMNWWDPILAWFGGLDIRLNAGGYLAIAIPLFLLWVFSVFIYDHYTYLIVARGQVRIRQEIGEGEVAVDSGSVVLDKKRNDLFRHWLLGFGSGDLHVKTGGVSKMDFELPNVLGVSRKIDRIQDMLREKEVTSQVPVG